MTSKKVGLSRRSLMAGSLGAGLLVPNRHAQGSVSAEDVANGLACCIGAIDFALVLGLKADLEDLREVADELVPRIDHLAEVMPKLVARLQPLEVQFSTKSFAETTTASTAEMAGALRVLDARLGDMLSDEVLIGQTSDSLSLFVSKTSSVANLIAQVAQSLIQLRQALEKENIDANEYESFIQGKMDSWPSILAFLDASKRLSDRHAELSQAAAKAKATVEAALVDLHGGAEVRIEAKLAEDLKPIRERVRQEDQDAFTGTLDLLGKLAEQVGKPSDDSMLMASVDGGYSGLRERVVATLTEATHKKATTYQIGVVVLAARMASFLPNPTSQKNAVATAILMMLPRLAFDPRNLTKALALAEAIMIV